MKNKIKEYVDGLFTDIYETKQLKELKEEISANLLEKVNDFISAGNNEDFAFKKAISSLGDMSELIGSLKKASELKCNDENFKTFPLTKKQVTGYVLASAIFLFGIMVGGIIYLKERVLQMALEAFMPFILISAPIFIYYGLIQETRHHYGMNNKRALSYALISEVFLLGAVVTGIEYFERQELLVIFITLMPFIIVSASGFLYLGLTEKRRRKMGPLWERQWVEYYSNPQSAILRGSISGALWIFAIAAFFLVAFVWGWKYSWIVFVAAIGIELIIEAFFAVKRKDN